MTIAITGNTYPVKEALKAIGAKWNQATRAWMIDESKADEVSKIMKGNKWTYADSSRYQDEIDGVFEGRD